MPKGFITIKQASEILGLSAETLRKWDKKGKLKAHRDPKNRYRLYKIAEIEKFIKTDRIPQKLKLEIKD